MPARRSQDARLTPAERAGDGALEHWDEERRRRAVPAPLERSLPDRDNQEFGTAPPDGTSDRPEPSTSTDGERHEGGAEDSPATDE